MRHATRVPTSPRTDNRILIAASLLTILLTSVLTPATHANEESDQQPLIGYSEFQTNLPGGRHANVTSMRARAVRADGTGRLILADDLITRPHMWTQFAGWSPGGKQAIIGCGWESPENGQWEEEHKTFRFNKEGWLYDTYLVDIATGKSTNLTAVERVSFYNTGLFFWPNKPNKLGFQALIGGNSHPFVMDLDGRNKLDLTKGAEGFTYGYSASPDGTRISYHKSYQVFIANADGSNPIQLETGDPFNFSPKWSPDGKWLMFLSGQHYNCHPYIAKQDGTGLRKLADRNGYRGVVEFLDVADFHGGSSDIPNWAADVKSIYYTAKIGPSVELMQAFLDGMTKQLTHSKPGTLHYHPTIHRNGQELIIGSTQTGTRQLYVMNTKTQTLKAITNVKPGWGAMWPHWQNAN